VCLHEVENPLLEVVKHGDLHCMEEVGHREVAHDTGNMSKHVECSVKRHATRVQHWLPWCWHCGAFDIGCDPAGGVACQEGHHLQVGSLDTRTKSRHAARDDVGRYTQGNLQAMLLKPVCNS